MHFCACMNEGQKIVRNDMAGLTDFLMVLGCTMMVSTDLTAYRYRQLIQVRETPQQHFIYLNFHLKTVIKSATQNKIPRCAN